jgi:hypothetical protein
LRYEKLAVTGTHGQGLVVFHAEPGSASAQSLSLLASLSLGGEAGHLGRNVDAWGVVRDHGSAAEAVSRSR